MTATEWAAIVGALAWIPQIVSWVRDFFAAPKLTMFPSPAPEIGFTVYGTVLNLQCAISAAVEDAVIERMEVQLIHERGQRIVLPWRGLHETLAEVEMPTGEIERHRRQQNALALKVSTVALAEQVVMFQDAQFQDRLVGTYAALEKRKDHIEQHHAVELQSVAMLQSDEFAQLTEVIQSGMLWQEGWYNVIFRAKISERRTPFEFSYKMHISAVDVARLKQNVNIILDTIRAHFDAALADSTVQWNWRYPNMLPLNRSTSLSNT